MARRASAATLTAAALLAGMAAGAASAEAGDPAAGLIEAASYLDAAEGSQLRDAALATCILHFADQEDLVSRFGKAGWTQQDHEDGAFALHAPGAERDRLWVMLYEGGASCSLVDQLTGTQETRARIGEMLGEAFGVLAVTPADDCSFEHVTLPPDARAEALDFRLELRSGGDHADCASETASAVLIGHIE